MTEDGEVLFDREIGGGKSDEANDDINARNKWDLQETQTALEGTPTDLNSEVTVPPSANQTIEISNVSLPGEGKVLNLETMEEMPVSVDPAGSPDSE